MTNDVTNPLNGHELERRLAESWPVQEWGDSHVVLGVSGGADSVAMLRAIAALKERDDGRGKLYVAHLNHGLRGIAADEDEEWVKSLCERFKLALEVKRIDVTSIAAKQGDGWEAAARKVRYDFLRTTAEQIGGRFVVTGHTADDQVETVLHRILRGTGLEGLAGITRARALTAGIALVRPMLEISRREVLGYLAALGQEYRSDATNGDTQWTRNRLRHDLLPHLRGRYNTSVDDAFRRLAVQAGEVQQVIVGLAAPIAADCVVTYRTRVKIDCPKLKDHPPIVVREVLKVGWRQAGWPEQAMGFDQWQQLAALAVTEGPATLNLPGNIRARRERQFIILEVLAGQPDFP